MAVLPNQSSDRMTKTQFSFYFKNAKLTQPKQMLLGVRTLTGHRNLEVAVVWRFPANSKDRCSQATPDCHNGPDLAVSAPLGKPVLRL